MKSRISVFQGRPAPPSTCLNTSDIPRRGTRTASQLSSSAPHSRAPAAFHPNSKNRSNLGVNAGVARTAAPLWQFNFRAFHAINAPICTRSSQLLRLPRMARAAQVDSARVSQNRTPTLYSIQVATFGHPSNGLLSVFKQACRAGSSGRGTQNRGVSGVQFGISAPSLRNSWPAVRSFRIERRHGG
jgi:hypothetical protein